ncbi:hypothetical protein [Massilia sp. Root351]|jgi:hypothetical protein|uniref:hypothetical protein n=1 Tax=Massilia sp. Root351 TaxID=1736522 RepID=UPI000B18556C|nr:hypothetical protein [Massilia sp. Root351]
MKLIINDNRVFATATDEHVPSGSEQAVLTAPADFDPGRIDQYRYVDEVLVGPVEVPE